MRIPRREIHQHCSVYHGVGNVAQLPAVSRLLRDFYLRCDSGISYSSIDEAYSDHHDLRLRFELVLGVDLTASHRYHRQETSLGYLAVDTICQRRHSHGSHHTRAPTHPTLMCLGRDGDVLEHEHLFETGEESGSALSLE